MSTAFNRSRRAARIFATVMAFTLLLGNVRTSAPARASDFDVVVSSVGDLAGLTATVDGAGGPVNLRTEPGLGAAVIDRVADGSLVILRVDQLDTVRLDGNRWWPVTVGGVDGWIAGAFLVASDGPAAASPNTTDAAAAADIAGLASGAYVRVATDDGAGLRIREGASTTDAVVVVASQGTWLQVLDGPIGDGWYYVGDGSVVGYVWGGWLEIAAGPATDAANVAEFLAGDWVRVAIRGEE